MPLRGFGGTMSKPRNKAQADSRRQFLKLSTCAGALAFASPVSVNVAGAAPDLVFPPKAFEFEEASVADLPDSMKSGEHSARSVAESYLARIDEMDKRRPAVNSV